MNMYQVLEDRVGTPEARDLAQQLVEWHDAMVRHLRVINHRGRSCPEGCPHEQARGFWSTAMDVFGDQASELRFLRSHGSAGHHHARAAGLELRA